jgi:hypothetical protein
VDGQAIGPWRPAVALFARGGPAGAIFVVWATYPAGGFGDRADALPPPGLRSRP